MVLLPSSATTWPNWASLPDQSGLLSLCGCTDPSCKQPVCPTVPGSRGQQWTGGPIALISHDTTKLGVPPGPIRAIVSECVGVQTRPVNDMPVLQSLAAGASSGQVVLLPSSAATRPNWASLPDQSGPLSLCGCTDPTHKRHVCPTVSGRLRPAVDRWSYCPHQPRHDQTGRPSRANQCWPELGTREPQ